MVYKDPRVAKSATIQRVATPTAFLVGLPEPLASITDEILVDGGLRVMRVGHVAAACERLPVVMPQLVVALVTMLPQDAEVLADRCVAVGAELLKVSPEGNVEATKTLLRDAANMALIRALRRGG